MLLIGIIWIATIEPWWMGTLFFIPTITFRYKNKRVKKDLLTIEKPNIN